MCRCMPIFLQWTLFGLLSVPHVFTKVLPPALALQWSQSFLIIVYLDDRLLRGQSAEIDCSYCQSNVDSPVTYLVDIELKRRLFCHLLSNNPGGSDRGCKGTVV